MLLLIYVLINNYQNPNRSICLIICKATGHSIDYDKTRKFNPYRISTNSYVDDILSKTM